MHAVLALEGLARGVDAERPPLSIAFAVDVSGSMRGEPLEHVATSLGKLVSFLGDDDRVGLAVFSDGASVVAPLAPLDPPHRAALRERARRLQALQRTNVQAGLEAARQLLPERALHERQAVMLLSDGQPNVGECGADALRALAASFRPDVSVSTLGYGAHHHEDLLVAIAHGGGGEYVFIHDPQECESELARAVGAQGEVVAEAIELRLRLDERVELAKTYAPSPPRLAGSALKLALPDLFEGQERVVVLELEVEVPAHAGGFSLGEAELRFRAPGKADATVTTLALELGATADRGAIVPEVQAQVLLGRTDGLRAEARAQADRGNFDAAAALLRAFMLEIEAAPAYVAGDGSPLSEAYEQLVDEAMTYETRPSAEQYRNYKRAFYGVEAATGGKHASDREARSKRSEVLMSQVAGDVPDAVVQVKHKNGQVEVIPLQRELTIGRVRGNDIVLPVGNVSKRHTRLLVRDGRVLVVDLRSTNGTYVNGERIDAPRTLEDGDKVYIGDATLTVQPK